MTRRRRSKSVPTEETQDIESSSDINPYIFRRTSRPVDYFACKRGRGKSLGGN